MHILYKLVALSIFLGLVVAGPAAKITPVEFDDLAYESSFVSVEDTKPDESRTVDVVLPKLGVIATVLGVIPKIIGLKAKALGLAVLAIKWLVPKTLFLAIGAIATFAFCKLTNKCNLAYDPTVYGYVPAEVQNFVTPERLEDAQQFLISAMQQYAKENI